MENNKIKFNKFYKTFNLASALLVLISIFFLFFKGLNFGVDFKGGTLIELRATDKQINISSLRNAFSNMNLGDVAIKKFGKEYDYLIKFEKKDSDQNLIQNIKNELTNSDKVDDVRIKSYKEDLKNHNNNLAQEQEIHKNLINERSVYEKASTLLKDGGIKTKIIRQYVPIINKLVNKYLAAMDFFVNFELNELCL